MAKKKKLGAGDAVTVRQRNDETAKELQKKTKMSQQKSLAEVIGNSDKDPALAALFNSNYGPLKPLKRSITNKEKLHKPSHSTDDLITTSESPLIQNSKEETTIFLPSEIQVNDGTQWTKKRNKRKRNEEDENFKAEDIESRYMTKLYSKVSKKPKSEIKASNRASSPIRESNHKELGEGGREAEGDNEQEIDPSILQDETLTPSSNDAEKTIFISNLTVKVLTSKPHFRSLKRLFSKYGQINSIRFRSIAFDQLLPRKIAFITKKLHAERDTLNAYVVYSSPDPIPQVVSEMNGFLWEGKHLRVDSVAKPTAHDNKRCVFVGNLPFDVQDEDIYTHFSRCGDIEFVRVVRDKKTNIGKGFGYVQFQDRDSIDKAILLNEKPLEGGKRNIRVTYAVKEGRKKNIKGNVNPVRLRLQKKERKERKPGRGDGFILEGKRARKDKLGGSGFKMSKKRGKLKLVEKRI